MGPGDLDGQVAIVTGAASGIGEAVAENLARIGADIAMLDRAGDGARRVADRIARIGRRAVAIEIDLGQSERIAGVVADVLDRFGRIDILVCSAANMGMRRPTTVLELAEADWDGVYAVNVKAPLLLMKHVAAHMVSRGGGGRIVNITSGGAFRATARPSYGSSKAALTQLSRTAAAELGPHGITVNCVAPGVTATPVALTTHGEEGLRRLVRGDGPQSNLLGRVARAEDVASAVTYLCLPEALQITAQTIHVNGGQAL